MSKSPRRKAAAITVRVPQSRAETAEKIAEIGKLRRLLGSLESAANDRIAEVTRTVEADLAPLREALEGLEKGVQIWAEAHRTELTDGGKTKTAELATGKLLWRLRPRKVSLRGVDDIIERIRTLELPQFLREKTEVDKEAMLKEPELAATIAGVTVASDGEDFVIEPLAIEVAA